MKIVNRISSIVNLLCLAALAAMGSSVTLAQTTPVLFSMQSLTGLANNRPITVTPDATPDGSPLVIGTNLVPIYPFDLQPVGGVVITNLSPWGYTIQVEGWPRSAHIVVPLSTNIINAATLINTNQFAPLNIYNYANGVTSSDSSLVVTPSTNGTQLNFDLSVSPGFVPANASNVNGSQAAIIAAATTNYPNVVSFLAANTNLSTEAQNELNAYQRELALFGQSTNLIDLFPFNPRFNPGSNCISLLGRTEYWSNIVMTTHGVSGVNGGIIVISNMPDLRTNTMVITWRFPNRVTSISQYYLAGAVDPASKNSEWMYGGPWPACMITQGTTQPAASAGVWNEFMGASYSYNYWSPHEHFRHVSVLSSSNGVFQAFDNGVSCLLTTSPAATYNTGVTLSNPLTNVWIFNAPGLQGSIPGGMNGEVESVQVFKGAATSNLVVASWFAANELENENTWYTFITDSRGSPDECTSPYTNFPAFYMMNNASHYNQVCFDHFGLSGQYNFDFTNATEVYRVTFLYAPHGRFTRENLHYSLNINDLYNGGLTPAQIWPFYVTWSGLCLSNNVEMHVMTTSQTSTNTFAGGFTFNATTDGYRQQLNGMMMTNSFMFSKVDDLDGMISQFDVNTNNLFSLEGLHFTGTNGWVKNQQIGQLMDNDYNQTPINYTNGVH